MMVSVPTLQHFGTLRDLHSRQLDVWYVRGYVLFHCLFACSEVGVLDELARGRSVDLKAMARRKKLNYDVLEFIARYLFGLGILNRDIYGRYCEAVHIPAEDLAFVQMLYAYDPLFHDLTAVLRNRKAYGRHIDRIPLVDARATAAICRQSSYQAVIGLIQEKKATYVLDLGCGAAEFLIQLCQQNANVRGVGVDISADVVKYAARRIKQEKLEARIRVGVGDILNLGREGLLAPSERRSIDLVVSIGVSHEFAYGGIERLVAFFLEVRRNFPSVELLVFEALEQPDDKLRQEPSALLEHHLFHRLSRQGIASTERWQAAFRAAGYLSYREIPARSGGIVFVAG